MILKKTVGPRKYHRKKSLDTVYYLLRLKAYSYSGEFYISTIRFILFSSTIGFVAHLVGPLLSRLIYFPTENIP